MKSEFVISRQEAKAIIEELKKSWITPEYQQIVYKLLTRLENELSS